MLAAKASLAVRVDALGEDDNHELGLEHQAKLQNRLRHLEAGHVSSSTHYPQSADILLYKPYRPKCF